jgi:anti-sigma factor RsiW
MRSHLTESELRRLTAGTPSAAEATELREHLAGCEACRELAAGPARATLERQLFGFDDARHLDEEQLAGYVDGALDAADREIVETHLEDCAVCRADVANLRLPAAPRRSRSLLAIAAVVTLLLLAAGAIFLLLRRPAPSPPTQPVIVDTTPATTTTAPASYGRAEWDALVRDALATGAIAAPSIITDLAGRPDPLRGPVSGDASLQWPVATAVDSARPEFRWTGEGESIVAIARDEDEVLRSEVLREPRWTPPRDLSRGQIYSWTVELRRPDGTRVVLPPPSEPMARFRVLSAAGHEEWAEAQRRHPDDALLLGLVAARLGLRAEAERELARHARQHPDDATAARLRDSLRKWP